MNVTVDDSKCEGHGLCNMSLQAVFKLRADDGHAEVDLSAIQPEFETAIRAAEATCPESAIAVTWA